MLCSHVLQEFSSEVQRLFGKTGEKINGLDPKVTNTQYDQRMSTACVLEVNEWKILRQV